MVGGHHEAEEQDDEGGEGVAGDRVGLGGRPVRIFGGVGMLVEVRARDEEGGVEEVADTSGFDEHAALRIC